MEELLAALGYVGDAMDKPGRAVRGVLSGRANEALAAVPFSDSLGLTDPTQAVSGRQLLAGYGADTGDDLWDSVLGVGAEVALDPTTYLGGFLGRAAGRAAGRRLDLAAAARGPGYGGLVDDDLAKILAGTFEAPPAANKISPWGLHRPGLKAGRKIDEISAVNQNALYEVPPGSSYLGAGDEAVAFRTPSGDVVRLAANPQNMGRPVNPNVLQATRSAFYRPAAGSEGRGVLVERTPFASPAGEADVDKIIANLEGGPLQFWDAPPRNAGVVGGRPVITDPGAVAPAGTLNFSGNNWSPVVEQADPGRVMSLLLDALGGRPAMRRALDAGRPDPGYERLLAAMGGAGGVAPQAARVPAGY